MTTEITVIKNEAFTKLEAELSKLIEYCNIEVKDLATKKVASDALRDIKKAISSIDDKRKECLEPLTTATNLFNAHVKLLTEPAKVARDELNKRFIAYVQEQERLAREEAEEARRAEIRRLEEEKKLTEQAILDSAESAGDNSLIGEAIAKSQEFDALIEANKNQQIIVETKTTRGFSSSTGLRHTAKAKIIDEKLALEFIAISGRFEMVEFVASALSSYAKNRLPEDKSQKVEENGMLFYWDVNTSSRS